MLSDRLSNRRATLRDWGLFVLVALVPAVAIGLMGLRALSNEEAAIKREMRLMLEQSADGARRDYEQSLERLAQSQVEPPAFADPLVLDGELKTPTRAERPSKSVKKCRDLAGKVRRGDAAAIQELLAHCEDARTDNGRWLWLVVALGPGANTKKSQLFRWVEEHGEQLTPAERTLAQREVQDASWLSPVAREAVVNRLKTGAAEAAAAPIQNEQRYAMRMGRARIAWSHERSRGLLVRDERDTYRGYVVSAPSLKRALDRGWPSVPSDVRARLSVGAKPSDGAVFEVLTGGAWVALTYRNPGAVEARTQRSKRILLGVAAFATLVALALVGLLFARMRAERRVGALRTDFVAAVSHELRTPIASMRMLSELLADGSIDDEDEKAEMHQALAKEAKRLGDTVNRLLGFSRMEAGKQTVKLKPMPLAGVVEDAVRTVEERHPDSDDVVRELDRDIEAAVDEDGIKMAVMNLLHNAHKYAKAPYTVTLARVSDGVRIAVTDSGPGLSRRDQKRIFKPFERADDRLSEATEGSGIGLSLVSHVARSHQGKAGVDSELGRGSTFFIWLPTHAAKDNEPRVSS